MSMYKRNRWLVGLRTALAVGTVLVSSWADAKGPPKTNTTINLPTNPAANPDEPDESDESDRNNGAATQGESSELDRQQKFLELQKQMLEGQQLSLQNHGLALKNMSAELQNEWMARELQEFHRLQNIIVKDLVHARGDLGRIQDQRRELMRFVNGQTTSLSLAGMLRSIRETEQTPEMMSLVQVYVSPIDGSDFERKIAAFQAIRPDGSLVPIPAIRSGYEWIHPDTTDLTDAWTPILESVRNGEIVSDERLNDLQRAIERWSYSAEQLVRYSAEVDKCRVMQYERIVRRLVTDLSSPRRVEQLREYLDPTLLRFNGGTVADLIRHVMDRRVSVKYGSRAQLLLSELGHDLKRDLDEQVAVLEQRLELLKSQNPSHRASIKQLIVAQRPNSDSTTGDSDESVGDTSLVSVNNLEDQEPAGEEPGSKSVGGVRRSKSVSSSRSAIKTSAARAERIADSDRHLGGRSLAYDNR